MKIRIVQCLCGPARHAILALGVNDATMPDGQAREMLQAAVAAVLEGRGAAVGLDVPALNPWCGICGATVGGWTYEIGWSRNFANWDEAVRVLRESEAENRATAALLTILDTSQAKP